MALLYETMGEKEQALKIWSSIKTKDAAAKTLELLYSITEDADHLRRLVKSYLKWVLQEDPVFGIRFFTGKVPSSYTEEQASDKIHFIQEAMSFEDTLTFLEECAEINKDSGKKDTQTQETFLEFLIKSESTPDSLFTKLAELYIDRLLVLHKKGKTEQVTQWREKLQHLIDTYSQYNASLIMTKLKDTFLLQEQIILLTKENRHKEAIQRYIDQEMFKEAEEFCVKRDRQDKQTGLLTVLISVYFEQYQLNMDKVNELKEKVADAEQVRKKQTYKDRAEMYRDNALGLIRDHASKNTLDPMTVLNLVPEDWTLKSEGLDLVQFLVSMFDRYLTKEENSKIAKNLSNMEFNNAQNELNDYRKAYKTITHDTFCEVCKRKMDFKAIYIYPNGEACHQRCAADVHECPVTRQRFDLEGGFT